MASLRRVHSAITWSRPKRDCKCSIDQLVATTKDRYYETGMQMAQATLRGPTWNVLELRCPKHGTTRQERFSDGEIVNDAALQAALRRGGEDYRNPPNTKAS